jgi:HNH endonuclease
MICGPGIEVAHIIPKSMYQFYPNVANDDEGWNLTNSSGNCILLDSLTHVIHDNRLIAIQPSSQRIRLFAPVKPLLERSNRQAGFGGYRPAWESLDWHYKMCVVENMCAILLQEEGGAKRVLRKGLPVSEIDEGTGDESREGIGGPEDNDDTTECGDGPSGTVGPDASGSGPFTHGVATELHSFYKPSSSISISRHDSTTTTDATPSTPPELFPFEENLQNPKYNTQADTMTSLQNIHPRLRIYTGSSITMPTEDDYCDSGEEESFILYNEDEETSNRRRKISEELMRWVNGEVNQAVNI